MTKLLTNDSETLYIDKDLNSFNSDTLYRLYIKRNSEEILQAFLPKEAFEDVIESYTKIISENKNYDIGYFINAIGNCEILLLKLSKDILPVVSITQELESEYIEFPIQYGFLEKLLELKDRKNELHKNCW